MPVTINGDSGITDVNGTAAAPALTGTDTDSGIFFPAVNTVGFATNGAEVGRFDSSGNLGVGTTSPSFTNFGGGGGLQITNATYGMLKTTGSSSAEMYVGSGNAINWVWGYSNHPTVFATNNTERARIDSSGNLLVGKTTTADNVVGVACASNGIVVSTLAGSTNSFTTFNVYSTGAGAYRFYVGMGGTVYATNTTISAISDIRFKENIRDLDSGLAEVMALKPRLYDWKEGKGADIKNARGFIAQEFEQVFPDLIDEWKDPAPEGEEPYKSVRADLIPVLVKAIQEQQAMIVALKAELDSVKAELSALKP